MKAEAVGVSKKIIKFQKFIFQRSSFHADNIFDSCLEIEFSIASKIISQKIKQNPLN